MAIGVSSGIVRLPFTERQEFGSPYPEGIAVGRALVTGDASGGEITVSFVSDGHFLYRLELAYANRNTSNSNTMEAISAHRWASDRSGLGATSFDLTWRLERDVVSTFQVFTLRTQQLQMIRRFPIGRTDDVLLQQIWAFLGMSNVLNEVYDFNLVFTYWRQEAMYRPGFLQSFFEAPPVTTPVPGLQVTG